LDAVQSVLSQEGPAFEVLAVNDGSEDDGPRLMAGLAREDERLRCMDAEGRGIVSALNTAVRHAQAPYLARMDADDIALPGRFGAQHALLEGTPTLGAAGTQVGAFPEEAVGEGLARYVDWQNSLLSEADHARDLFVEAPLCHPSVMLRRGHYESVGGYVDSPWAEDYDLWLRMSAAGFGLAKVERVLLRWRHHETRLTLRDPRYAPERFTEARAHYLAPRIREKARPMTVWGAGTTGKRTARALEIHGLSAARFVDIDPKKIGRMARGVQIVSPDALRRATETVVVAVGSRGARLLIRNHLLKAGFVEGTDFICAA